MKSAVAALLFTLAIPSTTSAAWTPAVTPTNATVAVGDTEILQGSLIWSSGLVFYPAHFAVGSDQPQIADISGSIDYPSTPDQKRIFVRGIAPGVARVIASDGSELGTVTVIPCPEKPQVSATPSSPVIIGRGQTVKLSVSVIGLPPASYIAWFAGNLGDTTHPVVGGYDPTVTVTPQVVGTYHYWARVTGRCSEVAAEFQVDVINPKRRGR